MIWLLLIPLCLILGTLLTVLAIISLEYKERPEERQPCAHPWYIDGRCMVCGTPK